MKKCIALRAGVVFFLVGCAGPQPSIPAPYTVLITADSALNPDRNGKPAPVQVKIFRLRSVNAFSGADFFSLYEKDEQILATDLLSKDVFTLQPGEAKTLTGKATDDERVVGIFVAYRDLENALWRGFAPLPQPKRAGRFSVFSPSFKAAYVKVHVGSKKVTVTTSESDSFVTTRELPRDAARGKGTVGLPPINTPRGASTPTPTPTPTPASIPF